MNTNTNTNTNTNQQLKFSEAALNGRVSSFFYYIPSHRRIPNPTSRLRNRAVRRDGSNWIIPSGDIPWDLYNSLTSQGAEVGIFKFDIEETARLLTDAIAFSKEEIKETLQRAEESARKAAEKMQTSEQNVTIRDEQQQKYIEHQKTIIKRCRQLLKDLKEAYRRFGVNINDYINLNDANTVIDSINAAMKQKALAYVVATNRLRQQLGAGNALVKAAERSEIPAEILADAMEDCDLDASGLRAAFQGVYNEDEEETVTS